MSRVRPSSLPDADQKVNTSFGTRESVFNASKNTVTNSSASRKGSENKPLSPAASSIPRSASVQYPSSTIANRKISTRITSLANDVGHIKRKSLEILVDGFAQLRHILTATGPTEREISVGIPIRRNSRRKSSRRFSIASKVGDAYSQFETKIPREVLLVLEAFELLYIAFSVPFRLALLFDPYGGIPKVEPYILYLLWSLDASTDLISLIATFRLMKVNAQSTTIAPLDTEEPSFGRKNSRRNSAFQQSLVRFATVRQQTMRRNSAFLAKETSMKPQFLLSSTWDKNHGLMTYQIAVEWLALIPFDLFWMGSPNEMILCRLPKILRLYKIGQIARLIKHTLAEHELLAGFHNIGMSLLVGILLISLALFHWAVCLFLFVEHLQCGFNLDYVSDGQTCWARETKLQGATIFRQYFYILFVVGYGFPIPRTNLERFVVISIQFMRCCIAGAIIASFIFLFECQNRRENDFHDQVDGVKQYLVARRISKQIQTRVLDFYEHFWSAQRGIDEDAIINSLPSHIQTQCLDILRGKLLKSIPIFRKQPRQVLNRLVIRMKRQCYGRGDYIIRSQSYHAIFMVCRGRICVLDIHGAVIKNVLDGQYFGLAMMQDKPTDVVSVRAETICDLYSLDKESILKTYEICAKQVTVPWEDLVAEATRIAMKPIRANSKLGLGKKFVETSSIGDVWHHPDSRFRKHWEQAVIVILIMLSIDIPYHACFKSKFSWVLFGCRVAMDIFLLIDFAFRSRYFSYIENGSLVTDPWFIWNEYKQHGFYLDAVSNLPFALIADCLPDTMVNTYTTILHLCKWLRFFRMRRLLPTLAHVLRQFQVDDTTSIIVNMFFCVPFTCHIGGCIWYWFGSLADFTDFDDLGIDYLSLGQCLEWARDYQNCSWIVYDHAHFGKTSDYVRSFYWSVTSLVSVQSGSIMPFTDYECIYMFCFLFLSSVANFGAVGAIVNAVTRINAASSKKQEQVNVALRFMTLEGVSWDVRHNVSDYYKHHWTLSTEQRALSVLKPLPDNLRQEIQSFFHATSVSQLTVFQVLDKSNVRYIYSIMKHQSYKHDDYIVRNGDAGDNIYILTRGVMEGLLDINEIMAPFQLILPGYCLGESTFVQKRPHEFSVRVVSESADVSAINRRDFGHIMHHFTEQWPKIEELAAELSLVEKNTLKLFNENLRKPNIFRTLNQSQTLYYPPSHGGYPIRQGSRFYRCWELLLFVVVLYNLIQITFRVSFLPTPSDDVMLIFIGIDVLCDIIYLLDMYIKYNHLVITDKNGDEVTSIPLIRSTYISRAFRIEAMASLPLYYVGDYGIMTFCRLPRLIRCYQIPSFLRSFNAIVQEQTSSPMVNEGLEFVKLLLTLVLASHVSAAGLYICSKAEYHEHVEGSGHHVHTWFVDDFVVKLFDGSLGAVYLRAFYWGLGILSSFDFMDIEMAMIGETLWYCAVALTGVILIAVIIGQVFTATLNASKEIREKEMQLENFAFYAEIKRLPKFLVHRAELYFEYQLDCNRGMDAHSIFSDLPHCLRMELYKDLYAKLLHQLPLFSTMSSGQVTLLAEKLHSELYLPGDNIIVEGDVGDVLYILKQGLAEKYLRSCHLVLGAVYEGNAFGELGFFLSMRYPQSIRAVNCCEVLSLTKADWMNAWSNEVALKFKVKMAIAVQKELRIMERISLALKQNFGLLGTATPMKLTMMLGLKKRQSFRVKVENYGGGRMDTNRRNIFEYLKESAKAGGKKAPHLSHHTGTKGNSIWVLGPDPFPFWIPESMFRCCWDMLMLLITIYYLTILPFRASFVQFSLPTPLWIKIWFACDYILDCTSICDFILRFQYFYTFAHGEMQTTRNMLRKLYRKQGYFKWDIISIIPFEFLGLIVSNSKSWQIASLCRLNRMIRLVHLPHLTASFHHILTHWEHFESYQVLYFYNMTFIAPFLIVCHWVACAWFYFSYSLRDAGEPSWLISKSYMNINDAPYNQTNIPIAFSDRNSFTSLNVYLVSLYYAFSGLTSQAFGDVICRNTIETWMTIGIMIFAVAFYGVLVGMLSELMQDHLHPRARFEQHMVDVSTFYNYRLLPFDFFIHTSRYCRTEWQNNKGRREDDYLSVLSTTIREDIAMYVKQNLVKSLGFLTDCEEVFVRILVTKLQTEHYIHADIIYQFGDVDRVLYFINMGNVSLASAVSGVIVRNSNEFFGGVSLFQDNGRTVTALANVECTMFLLHYIDFKIIIDRFPEYFERCYTQWYVLDEDPTASPPKIPTRGSIDSPSQISSL